MKIELSDYFKEQGFRSAYLFVNNMGRNCVELVHESLKSPRRHNKRFISYAKYLWISENKCEVPEGMEVDHINGNGKDDRIDNLQIITKHDNIIKEKIQNGKIGRLVADLVCPICGKTFTKRLILIKRSAKHQPNCCSISCSTKLQSMKVPFNRKEYIEKVEKSAYKVDSKYVKY